MIRIKSESKSQRRRVPRGVSQFILVGCAALAVAASVGLMRTQAQESFPLPAINPPGAKAAAPASGTAPSPASQSALQQPGTTDSGAAMPEAAQQCAELLRLATDLKAAVDKSSAGTLSVTVVRKAGEIEQLAHKVRNENARN